MSGSDSIRALYKIFKEKQWSLKDEEDIVFDNFFNLLEVLEPQEKELLLELTSRYLWISGNEYQANVKEVLNMVPAELLEGAKKLYLFPIIEPNEQGKAKSGITVVYEIKAMLPMLPRYRHITPISIDDFQGFNKAPGTKENELLFIVDDFIGTGGKAIQCLDEISKRMKIDYGKIIIISISCQNDSYEMFTKKGFNIFSKYIIDKAITDYNIQPEIDEKKNLMRFIEKSIPGSGHYSLGWQESEAAITLKRTPDNTFPIFWQQLKRKGKWFNAPFLRN